MPAVQRGISGSWQALVTAATSSRVRRRNVTTVSEGVPPESGGRSRVESYGHQRDRKTADRGSGLTSVLNDKTLERAQVAAGSSPLKPTTDRTRQADEWITGTGEHLDLEVHGVVG